MPAGSHTAGASISHSAAIVVPSLSGISTPSRLSRFQASRAGSVLAGPQARRAGRPVKVME